MPRTKNNGENSSITKSKLLPTTPSVKTKATAKKQMPVNIKIPTARERAKEFDAGRRHDAESNEL